MLTWPFIALGWVTSMVQRGAASMARLTKLFETKPEIRKLRADKLADRFACVGRSSFTMFHSGIVRNLVRCVGRNFASHRTGNNACHYGPHGFGKNDASSISLRACSIQRKGALLSTDTICARSHSKYCASQIGFVTQEPFLFSETISQNIAFGTRETSGSDPVIAYSERPQWSISDGYPKLTPPSPLGTEEAARAADIYDNVMGFPEQFETMIGERGITLSGGQKQRTAIARAH